MCAKKCKSCTGADMIYSSQRECVFILELYFTMRSSAAVHEALSKAYFNKEVPNKTTIYQLATKNLGHGKCLQQESYLVSDSVDR
jgi:hypothetical protein